MAHGYITCAADTWTQLTDSDVTTLRVQNMSPFAVTLQATADGTAPVGQGEGLTLPPGQILLADTALSDLFPGVPGASRVWAYRSVRRIFLSVSHA